MSLGLYVVITAANNCVCFEDKSLKPFVFIMLQDCQLCDRAT